MMEPLISIQIQNERFCYEPGDRIECDYQIDAVGAGDIQAVEASVLWYTEGKGGEDMGIHFFERRVPTDADGDLRQWHRFQTILPNSPLSYDGVIVKLRWCVRVRVFLNRGKETFLEQPFQLGQVPRARAVLPKPEQEEPDDEDVFGDVDEHAQ